MLWDGHAVNTLLSKHNIEKLGEWAPCRDEAILHFASYTHSLGINTSNLHASNIIVIKTGLDLPGYVQCSSILGFSSKLDWSKLQWVLIHTASYSRTFSTLCIKNDKLKWEGAWYAWGYSTNTQLFTPAAQQGINWWSVSSHLQWNVTLSTTTCRKKSLDQSMHWTTKHASILVLQLLFLSSSKCGELQ